MSVVKILLYPNHIKSIVTSTNIKKAKDGTTVKTRSENIYFNILRPIYITTQVINYTLLLNYIYLIASLDKRYILTRKLSKITLMIIQTTASFPLG